MTPEIVFRVYMFLTFIGMLAIRIYFQSQVLREGRKIEVQENRLSLLAGGLAAISTLVFGFEYIFFRGVFGFAYLLRYPDWLRWLGVVLLTGGIGLLWYSHFHLDRSFHSLVVSKAEHQLVTSGPYRWIRHPIYTAYLINYLAGGLVASNWPLTLFPVILFGLMIYNRIPREEALMREEFGQEYLELESQTGQLLPKINRKDSYIPLSQEE